MSQAAGIIGAFTIPLYFGQTVVWPPAGRPLGADLVDELLDKVKVDSCFLAPSILEELSQSQTSIEKLAKVNCVYFAGG